MKARNKQLSSVGKWRFMHVGGGAGSVGFQCFPKSSSGCLSSACPASSENYGGSFQGLADCRQSEDMAARVVPDSRTPPC